jgi:hypothetical protein
METLGYMTEMAQSYVDVIGQEAQNQPPQQKQLHEKIRERIENTLDTELSELEKNVLLKDIITSIKFTGKGIAEKRYGDAMKYAQRTIDNIDLITQYAPEMEEALNGVKATAEDAVRKALTMWENNETGKMIIELEDYIGKEKYGLATQALNMLKEKQPVIAKRL